MTADRGSCNPIAKTSNQRPPLGDCRLHGWKLQGSLMTGLTLPHLSDPEPIGFRGVGGDYVAQTAGHITGAIDQNLREGSSLTCDRCDLANQTVHRASSSLG